MKRAHYVVLVALLTMLLAGCGSPPPIPEEAINGAYDVINQYDGVRESLVDVQGRKIVLVLIVSPATSEQYAKQLGENFARALAAWASSHSEDFKGLPTKEYLGKLYELYDLDIRVAWNADHVIAHGIKTRGKYNSIRWID